MWNNLNEAFPKVHFVLVYETYACAHATMHVEFTLCEHILILKSETIISDS
jgi:hypothetical protein